ncbi:MAG: hypothetical protein AAF554_18615 [Bacteroidota bacterium]
MPGYNVEYNSVNGDQYQITIDDGAAIQLVDIEGRATYDMTSVNSIETPIREKTLSIQLIATTENNLEDLLVRKEKYWRVNLYRNSQKIFFGYLSTEGAIQEYNADRWILSVSALGPMSFLGDIAYKEASGLPYIDDEILIKILSNAISRGFERTGDRFLFYCYFDLGIRYRVSGNIVDFTSGNVLSSVRMPQLFFRRDIRDTDDCILVVESVLSSLGLCITQVNGNAWAIYPWSFDPSGYTSNFVTIYDADGEFVFGEPPTLFNTVDIVTDNNVLSGYELMFCDTSNSYNYKRGLDKIEVRHSFVYQDSNLPNAILEPNGSLIDDWNLGTRVEVTSLGYQKVLSWPGGGIGSPFALSNSSLVSINARQQLQLTIECEPSQDLDNVQTLRVWYRIGAVDQNGNNFYLDVASIGEDNEQVLFWTSLTTGINLFFDIDNNGEGISNNRYTLTQTLREITTLGSERYDLTVTLLGITGVGVDDVPDDFLAVYNIDLVPLDNSSGTSIFSELDTIVNDRADNKEINIDTSQGSVLQNQIFADVPNTPQIEAVNYPGLDSVWSSLAEANSKLVLKNRQQKRFFEISCFNFFEPLDTLEVSELDSAKYRCTAYSFDTAQNKCRATLEQYQLPLPSLTTEVDDLSSEGQKTVL